MSEQPSHRIYPCGDHAITVEWGNRVDPAVNQIVMNLFRHLQQQPVAGVLDIIPAYHTVTLVYNPGLLKKQHPGESVYHRMQSLLQKAIENLPPVAANSSRQIRVPVCYDLSLAPDLASLAEQHRLTVDEVIQLHTATTYQVYMIGFLPGFAYMGTVNSKIRTARKAQPRAQVAAGSVGIADGQTGIYPFDSPGGWQLIGQTPVQVFSVEKAAPCYFQPGDAVQFYAITIDEFRKLKAL